MEPQIDFSFQLTERDIAGMYDEASVRWRKRCLLPGVVLGAAGFAGLIVQPDWFTPSAACAALTIGFLLIYCGTFAVGAFRRAGVRRFRLNPSASVKTRYQFFDDHLTATSELFHSEIRWQAFLTRKENPAYLHLILNPAMAFVIPLAYLAPSQVSELQEFVRNRVPSLDAKAISRIAFRRDRSTPG